MATKTQYFEHWFVYYDSMLLKKINSLPSSYIDVEKNSSEEWPVNTKLQSLIVCFEQLEKFIKNQQTWIQSICTIEELNKVQTDVNFVLGLLKIQKKYVKKLWNGHNNLRRIEASITHLYCYIQLFIRAIIPYETMTMFECKAAKKLCINMKKLQDLIKSFSKNLNPAIKFLEQKFFAQEKDLIHHFFTNLNYFLQHIPKIKKLKMFHIAELSKYISVVNSLESCEIYVDKSAAKKFKQGYSCTKRMNKRQPVLRKIFSMKQLSFKYFDHVLRYRKAQTCIDFNEKQKNQGKTFFHNHLTIFKFPLWIRRHSIACRKQEKSNHFEYAKGKSNTETLQNPIKLKKHGTQDSLRNFSKTPTKSSDSSPQRHLTSMKQAKYQKYRKRNTILTTEHEQDERKAGNKQQDKIKLRPHANKQPEYHENIKPIITISLNNSQTDKNQEESKKLRYEELIVKYKIKKLIKDDLF